MPDLPGFHADDAGHMAHALRLAARGIETTTPNPRVGCVIVRAGQVVGAGYHERAGEAHAEVHALRQAGGQARGATAYVTLEPCAHYGRTPPCAEALLTAGVARVVAAMEDPNPLVAGRGLALLRQGGVAVSSGLLADAARELNRGFVSRMTRGRPWVCLKLAATLDGRTAAADGESKWITSEEARRDVHRLRARSCAVLTGIGTALADDPALTVRHHPTARQPLRVVLDSRLRLPPGARLLQGGALVYTVAGADAAAARALTAAGAEVVCLAGGSRLDLTAVLADLAQRGVNELLVEAGQSLAGAFIEARLVDELVCYMAPDLLGEGRGLALLPGVRRMADRARLAWRDVRAVGRDLRLTLRFNESGG